MSASSQIVIYEARTPEALQQARALRDQVFAVEQGIPAALVHDGLDASALHVLALHEGDAVATGRLTISAEREGVVARIAVRPAYRGQGLGRRLVQRLEALARREGLATISLNAHHHLEAFYARLGYQTLPGSLITAGPYQLITMTKTLL